MSKALEALRLCEERDGILVRSEINIIEKELQRLEAIDNANPSEALECMDYIGRFKFDTDTLVCNMNSFHIIKQALLKAQEQEKENKILKEYRKDYLNRLKNLEEYSLKQEKENELLKEIIKSLFDRGCPLHQYMDNRLGGLTIEVDDECSNMQLGEFKGVDLDKKLNEVLGNE